MSSPSRKSYPRVTTMNLDLTAQRKKAPNISVKSFAKQATVDDKEHMSKLTEAGSTHVLKHAPIA